MRGVAKALCILGIALLGVSVVASSRSAAAESALVIIVNPQNRVVTLSGKFVGEAFLKRVTRWSDGELIAPVDLTARSPVRAEFARTVLKRPLTAVRMYFQQLVFSGRGLPPPELDSEAAVVRYVARHRGGLGYVSAVTDVQSVKIVSLQQ
jgi:ABC-type phosphate transport system substrate-binding protein